MTLKVQGLGWHDWPNLGTHRYQYRSLGTRMTSPAKFMDRRWILLKKYYHYLCISRLCCAAKCTDLNSIDGCEPTSFLDSVDRYRALCKSKHSSPTNNSPFALEFILISYCLKTGPPKPNSGISNKQVRLQQRQSTKWSPATSYVHAIINCYCCY